MYFVMHVCLCITTGMFANCDRRQNLVLGRGLPMLSLRSGISMLAGIAAVLSCLAGSAAAQVPASLVAASGVPQGFLFAPHTPSGMVIIGNNVWVGDEVQGLHHYVPVDAANP